MSIIQKQLDKALKVMSSPQKDSKMGHQAKLNATKCQHKLNQLWTNNTESIINNNNAIMMNNKPPKRVQNKFIGTMNVKIENNETKPFDLQTGKNESTKNNNKP